MLINNGNRLSFTGHLYRADPGQDHHRALQACISGLPDNWRRRIGRPRQSWLRTVEADLRPMNLELATAKRRAQDRSAWRQLVATATSSQRRSWRRRIGYSNTNNVRDVGTRTLLAKNQTLEIYLDSVKHTKRYCNTCAQCNDLIFMLRRVRDCLHYYYFIYYYYYIQ